MTTQTHDTMGTPATKKRPLYQKILVIAAVMTTMGGTLTGIMTYVNTGLTDQFLGNWLSSFLTAVLVMMPAGLLFMTVISKLIHWLIPNAKKIFKQLATGVSMAFLMETVLAGTTAANTIGFSDQTAFIAAWSQGFIAALPVGLIMGLIMALFLKPKLDAFMAS